MPGNGIMRSRQGWKLNHREMQSQYYGVEVDYRHGSPHIQHHVLRDRLVSVLRHTLRGLGAKGLPLRVLEVGAGHGGYTEPTLAMGAQVTAVDMSMASVERLKEGFGLNDRLTCVHDAEGDLAGVGGGYSLLLCASVLHHMPDYISFIRGAQEHLMPGAAVLTIQDPLWYPRLNPGVHLATRAAYMAWRIPQGRLRSGTASFLRRLRGAYDESKSGDMVEYHVVRQGVDEIALKQTLLDNFEEVSILKYWSSQWVAAQNLGDRMGAANTFAAYATGLRG